MNKLFILGSSRGLGKEILKSAISKDYIIRALVRNNKYLCDSAKVKFYQGDATNIEDLRNSIGESEIIISSLNVMRKNIFPWSGIINSKNTVSEFIKNINILSKDLKIKRMITISAWGVGSSYKNIPFWFKYFIKGSNIKYPYLDHEKHEFELRKSQINWTIIRPTFLVNFGGYYNVMESDENYPKPNLFVSRKSLANFIINIINSNNHNKKIITVSKQ